MVLNTDSAQWVIAILALIGIAYNVVVTHTIVKNDLKHLERTMTDYKDDNTREHTEIKKTISCILQKIIDAAK